VPRALAWLLDLMVRVAGLPRSAPRLACSAAPASAPGLVAMFLVYWGYPIAFEVFRDGQTPGKRAFGLKVVSDNGTPVTWLPRWCATCCARSTCCRCCTPSAPLPSCSTAPGGGWATTSPAPW
jgi:uncharacterized RDD family membrane protein YckC